MAIIMDFPSHLTGACELAESKKEALYKDDDAMSFCILAVSSAVKKSKGDQRNLIKLQAILRDGKYGPDIWKLFSDLKRKSKTDED